MTFYQNLFYEFPEAAIITDKAHKINALNQQAEKILNTSSDEARGRAFRDVADSPQILSLLEETVMLCRPPRLTYENSTIIYDVKGRKCFFKISMAPMITFEGELKYVLTTMADITMLKEIEQLKTDFFATVSHEFRTPLTSMLMGVGMMKMGQLAKLTPKGREILEAIEEDCNRLLRLADNLLDLSRMEAGAITMDMTEAHAEKMIQAAMGTLRLQAENKGIKLITSVPSELPMIKADINKIIWVLTNLVGNALRYTGQGDTITVKARNKGTRMFFSVIDTGKGIASEYHDQIFQKFVQGDDPDYTSGGAGLGLAICKDIIEAHGGEIWLESEPGQGAVFTFSIPVLRDY